jgi:hypothetical protein
MAKASDSVAARTARAATLREQIEKLKGCGWWVRGRRRFRKGYPRKGGPSRSAQPARACPPTNERTRQEAKFVIGANRLQLWLSMF